MTTQAVVLVSGGLDSVSALFWARRHYETVRAITFDYGQPARDAECVAAGRATQATGVESTTLAIADTLALKVGLLKEAPAFDPSRRGLAPEIVPVRNVVFGTIAAAHACAWFPEGDIDVVFGCNREDAEGFPDCRPEALAALSQVLTLGSARTITAVAPWVAMTKAEIVRNISSDPTALSAVLSSWSCYRREGPCTECGACVKRTAALAELGMVDASSRPKMFGGDPHRELR